MLYLIRETSTFGGQTETVAYVSDKREDPNRSNNHTCTLVMRADQVTIEELVTGIKFALAGNTAFADMIRRNLVSTVVDAFVKSIQRAAGPELTHLVLWQIVNEQGLTLGL